jgi:hypothetical protein
MQVGSASVTTLILILIVAAIIVAAVLLARSNTRSRGELKAAESGADLHTIQLAIEKFATDSDMFPVYMIGGAPRAARSVKLVDGTVRFSDVVTVAPVHVSDQLLRRGYLAQYPPNPFLVSGGFIHQIQEQLPGANGKSDPLRNGLADGATLGTRFGADCTLMGNIMADPRFNEFIYMDPNTQQTESAKTHCDVEYPCWDRGPTLEKAPWLSGMFFYKCMGPLKYRPDSDQWPILPDNAELYMLGQFGKPAGGGKDVFGPEQRVASGGGLVWPWTRSVVRTDPTERDGSPYGAGRGGTVDFGNANGVGDAVTLLLTGRL